MVPPRQSFTRSSDQNGVWMKSIWSGMVAIAVSVLGLGVTAQDKPATPYVGQITFDSVEARSGAGRVFYPVAELKKGDTVTVVDDDFFGWFRVAAPDAVVAAVRQVDVEAKGSGERGVVVADIATVRVLGLERNAAESFKTLKTISKGDAVTILGRDGDYFLIKPPAESLVFLKPGSVEPSADQTVAAPPAEEFDATEFDGPADADDADASPVADDMTPADDVMPVVADPAADAEPIAEVQTDAETVVPEPVSDSVADTSADAVDPTLSLPDVAEPSTGTDAGFGETTVDAGSIVPADPAADPAALTDADTAEVVDDTAEELVIETPAVNAALRAVELEQLPRFYQPVEQQPLDDMQAAYEAVQAEQELVGVDQRIVDARLAAIERNRQFAVALAQIRARQEAVPRVEPVQVDPDENEPFAAIGVLSVSTVLSSPDGPTLFRVIDPATRRTIAYVRPAAGVDPAPSVGQIVGVRGARQYDASLNNQLIVAQQVRVLDGSN